MVEPDDPFAADGDRTIIKPIPGGRRSAAPPPPPQPVAPAPSYPPPSSGKARMGSALEQAAAPLLALLPRLRNSAQHPDLDGLRTQLIAAVRGFEAQARAAGASPEEVASARYCLCTALDEVVLNTPWGAASDWSQRSLLITFHNEAWGGEKFFLLLERLLPDPAGNRNLLELMYLCLALGFEGRYRVLSDGRSRLEELRERLYCSLRNLRGEYERELSPHWQGVVERRNPVLRHVPLWVAAALAGVLLLGLYTLFSYRLNRASDPLYTALHGLAADPAALFARPVALATPTPPPPKPTGLRTFLAEEIGQQRVELREQPGRTTILIRGDELFASGSAAVNSAYLPLLARIAAALKTEPGAVLVTGHTDDRPIFTPRFPSNWHLSQARAEAVKALLAAGLNEPGRAIAAEGRADSEPLAPNDSAANRARNRRVEIVLLREEGAS